MAKNNNKIGAKEIAAPIIVIVVIAIAITFVAEQNRGSIAKASPSGSQIQVAAAENFWGSLAMQICGIHCNVTSIITDPNADPHTYEASASVAKLISNSKFVVINGDGYDDWALRLLSAANNPNRTILDVASSLGIPNGTNPHLWYNPYYVNATVRQMYLDFVKIDPSNASYYAQQYGALNASLKQLYSRIAIIRKQFSGTKVAATEDIFVYLANATGLNLVSPVAFMQAVAEGNDPPVQSVTQFQNQLQSGNVSVLVYNQQTATPLTQQMKQIAISHNITVVGLTEVMEPTDASFQLWMASEFISLQKALNANALRQ